MNIFQKDLGFLERRKWASAYYCMVHFGYEQGVNEYLKSAVNPDHYKFVGSGRLKLKWSFELDPRRNQLEKITVYFKNIEDGETFQRQFKAAMREKEAKEKAEQKQTKAPVQVNDTKDEQLIDPEKRAIEL